MGTATALGLQVARRIRDRSQSEIDATGYLDFINMAIDDLISHGWLLPMAEDTSLTYVEGTFSYAVPSGFAYIRAVQIADSAGNYPLENTLPGEYWYITASDVLYFFPDLGDMLVDGRHLKLIGQKRPTGSISGSATIVPGMESFVRERAISYAAQSVALGNSELSQYRNRLAETTWAQSENMLAFHPQEFRNKVGSIYVPGR